MEIIGRDKITQTGNKTSVKIDNSASQVLRWYSTWWGKLVLGLALAYLIYVFGWN